MTTLAREEVLRMADAVGGVTDSEKLQSFANSIYQLGIAEGERRERERLHNEWSRRLQSDIEHGVSWFNEEATKDFKADYPEISSFGEVFDENYRARGDKEAG